MKVAKTTTLFAVGWTILCAVLLAGWQIASSLQKGAWDAFSVASLIKRMKADAVATYTVASADKPATSLTNNFVDWLLAVPAIVPLLIAAALLLGFYIWLNDVEKKPAS